MRLSLTDKCNLRCTYCMPAEGLNWLQKDQVLSRAEIVRLVRIGVDRLGVRELRLTGGEPLVRADLLDIIRDIRAGHADLPISMTTNALGLDRRAVQLKEAGLTRINVSMDMGDVWIVEEADHLEDGIHFTDMGKELVT